MVDPSNKLMCSLGMCLNSTLKNSYTLCFLLLGQSNLLTRWFNMYIGISDKIKDRETISEEEVVEEVLEVEEVELI